jgi:adenylate cyclase
MIIEPDLATGNRNPPPIPRWIVMGVLLAIPLAGLVVLLASPDLDLKWEHHPAHFWLVLGVALVNVGLGLATSEAARLRADPRLFLVSLALLISAGFLALHALATPGILVAGPNAGFVVATPLGLLFASVLAAVSAGSLTGRFSMALERHQRPVRFLATALLLGWAAASLAGLPPLRTSLSFDEAPVLLRSLAPVAVGLYAFAALRYVKLYLTRRRLLPLSVAIAFILLAEAMIAVAFSRSWHLTWWEWHVLMAASFGTIAVAARAEYRRGRSLPATFGGLYLGKTLERIDRAYSDAITEIAQAVSEHRSLRPILDEMRARQGFTQEETDVLERSAREVQRIDELFRPYVGQRLAERLLLEPDLGRLGGREVQVSALFADLAGFTSFSEQRSPVEVIEMLNTYWATAVPILTEREGGTIERFAGDAVLVLFNALEDQPDHPVRAAVAAMAMRDATGRIATLRPDWPPFRIAVNTGPAVVGNVGTGGRRTYTVVGDTANVAARLQAIAEPGQVLIGQATRERLGDRARIRELGQRELKGKRDPVAVYELLAVTP